MVHTMLFVTSVLIMRFLYASRTCRNVVFSYYQGRISEKSWCKVLKLLVRLACNEIILIIKPNFSRNPGENENQLTLIRYCEQQNRRKGAN